MLALLALLPACEIHTIEFNDTGTDLVCGPGAHEENGPCLPDDAASDTDSDTDTDSGTGGVNFAPSAPAIAMTPENPTQLSDLTCTIVSPATDPDGDAVTYTYAWFVHGVESTITEATVPDAATLTGDTWTCRVTASDGDLNSSPAEVSVALATGYAEVSVGTYHACGIVPYHRGETGEALCWGNNAYGEGSPPTKAFAHLYAG